MGYRLTVRTAPGRGLLTKKHGALLFIPEPTGPSEDLILAFASCDRGDERNALAEVLLANDFALPGFVCVTASDTIALRVFGDVSLVTDQRSVPMLSGAGSTTWVDHLVHGQPDAATISVDDDQLADELTDLVLGTVHAGGFRLQIAARGEGSAASEAQDCPTISDLAPLLANDLIACELVSSEPVPSDAALGDAVISEIAPSAAASSAAASNAATSDRATFSEPESSELVDYVLGAFGDSEEPSRIQRRITPTGHADIECAPADPAHADPLPQPTTAPPTDEAGEAPTAEPPSVMARVCGDDHANEPSRVTCSVCGAFLEPGPDALSEIPRPPLGRLMLDDGSSLVLDRDLVLGRNPSRFAKNTDLDTFVVSGDRLSRAHLTIRLRQWHIEIEDCGSRNGSVVVDGPDSAPIGLVPGTPHQITPGATIYFGSRSAVLAPFDTNAASPGGQPLNGQMTESV